VGIWLNISVSNAKLFQNQIIVTKSDGLVSFQAKQNQSMSLSNFPINHLQSSLLVLQSWSQISSHIISTITFFAGFINEASFCLQALSASNCYPGRCACAREYTETDAIRRIVVSMGFLRWLVFCGVLRRVPSTHHGICNLHRFWVLFISDFWFLFIIWISFLGF
jgi:ABC-type multidrug transport system permease subunit